MEFQHMMMRAMVGTVVSQAVRELQRDSHRGLRKLVDMGNAMLRGENQQRFFNMAARIVEDPDSPYYEVVRRFAVEVDAERLRILSMNLGYTALTYGAKVLRAQQEELRHYIPPLVVFLLSGTGSNAFAGQMDRLVTEASSLGTYLFQLVMPEDAADAVWDEVAALTQKHAEACFFVQLPAGAPQERVRQVAAQNNCISLIPGRGDDKNLKLFKQLGCLVGFYDDVTAANSAELLTADYLESRSKCGFLFGLYLTDKSDLEVEKQTREFAIKARVSGRSVILPLSFVGDLQYMADLISSGSGWICLHRSGVAEGPAGALKDAQTLPLQSIVSGTMPALPCTAAKAI